MKVNNNIAENANNISGSKIMEIIDSFSDHFGNLILRVFRSSAVARQNLIRQHRHTEFEISLILSGTGIYRTENGDYDIRSGDIFLYSANEYHCISDITPDPGYECMELLNVHFSPALLATDGITDTDSPLDVFFNRSAEFQNRLTRNNPHSEEIGKLLLKIREECEQKKPCYRTSVRNLICQILITITRNYGYTVSDASVQSTVRYDENLGLALAYINEHFCEQLTLDDIIEAAHMTKTNFINVFKASYNMTTWDYINIKRIDRAMKLLSSTSLTIIDIATRCGYNNTANFNRIFRKITGITPKLYRASKLNNR